MEHSFVAVTRFSVFHPGSTEWNASQKGIDQAAYESYLFSEERMDVRSDIFFNLSLPILDRARAGCDFRHIIQYSSNLPEKYIQKLKAAAETYEFVCLDCVTQDQRFDNYQKLMVEHVLPASRGHTVYPFALFNLDDDDLVSANFFARMKEYLTEENIGRHVSFGLGLSAYYSDKDGSINNVRLSYSPKINIGLTRICGFSPESGKIEFPKITSHTMLDRASPTIIDSREPQYLWLRSLGQDTTFSQNDRLQELLHIEHQLQNLPHWQDLDAAKELFPSCATRLKDEALPAISLLKGAIKLTSNEVVFPFDSEVEAGQIIELRYSLKCDGPAEPRSALISLKFSGNEPQSVLLFGRSDAPTVGWYQYLKTEHGLTSGQVKILVPEGAVLNGVGVRRWKQDDFDMSLEELEVLEH